MKRKLLVQIACLALLLSSSNLSPLISTTVASSFTDNIESEEEGTKSDLLVERLLGKLRERRFAELQAYFDKLIVEKPYTDGGSRVLEAIYGEMSARRDILGDLKAWCDSKEAGHSAFILRGKYHIDDAWRARGAGYAHTVSDEGRRLMRERLMLARIDLEKAFSMNPKDPNSAASMIVVCTGLSLDKETMEDWFQKAVSADECAFYAYSAKGQYLNPKWHGSLEEFASFAHSCYTNRPPCGRAYTVVLHFLYERARVETDKKAFWLDPTVRSLSDEVLKQWLKDFPNSTSAKVMKASIAEDIGKEQEAISYCNEALKIDPYNTGALEKRGDLYFNTDSYFEAENDFNQLLKLLPSNDYSLACLGKIQLYHHKNYERAIEFFDRAIKLNDRESWYYSERGKAYFKLNRYQAAIVDLDLAIRRDFKDGDAYYYRGLCLYSLGNQEAAMEDLRNARRLKPSLRPRIDGRLLSHDPMRFYNDALEEDPYNLGALLGRAEMHLFDKRPEKAKEDLSRAVEIAPNLDKSYYQLAKIAADVEKDYILAVKHLDKAISINPKEPNYYTTRGMAKYFQKIYSPAAEDFTSSINLHQEDARAYFYRGQCRRELNLLDGCKQDFLKAKELDQGYRQSAEQHLASLDNAPKKGANIRVSSNEMPPAPAPGSPTTLLKGPPPVAAPQPVPSRPAIDERSRQLMELRNSGMLHFVNKRKDDAIADFTKILELDPGNDYATFMLGKVQSQLIKDNRMAIKYFDRALALNSKAKEYLYEKGMAHYSLNEFDHAKDSFSAAIAIDDQFGKAYYYRGHCFWKLKQIERAKMEFRKAKEHDPSYGFSVDSHLKEMGGN